MLKTYKDVGTVQEVFRLSYPAKLQEILGEHTGTAAIGHTRYATCGLDDVRYAQPFERVAWPAVEMVQLRLQRQPGELSRPARRVGAQQHYHFSLNSDSEIILHALTHSLRDDTPPPCKRIMTSVSHIFDGAYNLVFLDAMRRMFVARDPLGFRPLSWAVQGRLFAAASESMALMNLGFPTFARCRRGRWPSWKTAHCASRASPRAAARHAASSSGSTSPTWPASSTTCRCMMCAPASASSWRKRKTSRSMRDCIVVPVPDTARTTANAFARRLGLPYAEGIIRNRYVGRTFIQPQNIRGESAKQKYTLIPSLLQGKRVLILEDSIVRCTTLLTLVKQLRRDRRSEGSAYPRLLPAHRLPLLLRHRYVHPR